ncbi:MAG: UDP-N-acetylmuramoyl-L-alanyl-D-glutamate--2,6-diaminopimelate ligase, partial [Deltaproteobacteria bacterium]|nr:UDP-N-acetylmuramoyl-L-alanyl-D-glutamate--2,6-diaminopimelate ligase [Deltaproteobacteria bacterium]
MTLRDFLDALAAAGLDARAIGSSEDVAVAGVRSDSREVTAGDVFVAVRGLRADGHDFVPPAIELGAAAVVVERELPGLAVPQIVVGDGAAALGVLVGRALGDPAKAMTLIGVTGTNGKTTTTYLVESILAASGATVGVIGTVEMRWNGPRAKTIPASYTTPTPQMLHDALAQMRDAGCTHVVMEVTSIAIAMKRVAGMQFHVAAFSNLTQDHLDVHGTMEAYRDAKRLLFAQYIVRNGSAVVNVDDPEGAGMAASARPGARILRASCGTHDAEIRVSAQQSTVRGITATIATPRGEIALEARPLIGHYNVANLTLAVGIAEALGLPHEAIARGIATLRGVPGRVERVAASSGDDALDIFVDYAHTPDALENVLTALRPLTKRRLICVFGCGGDRDPTKRPKMGDAVARLADVAVVTSDNPRTEDPRAILDQILVAVPRPFFVDTDRRVAIRAAIAEATPGDVVVIAGKGHEDYQILGTTKHHFDDREEAAAAVLDRWRRTLGALAADAGGALHGDADRIATRVVIDSRIAAPGDLYVAVRGEAHDGHKFCADAVRAGAVGIVVDKAWYDATGAVAGDDATARESAAAPFGAAGRVADATGGDAAHAGAVAHGSAGTIVVGDTRLAIGAIAAEHRRRWTGKLVAITGSAGKTTTKELARAALSAAGPTHGADGSLNNETGVPLTLLGLRPFHAHGVVEMGMRGAGQIAYLSRLAEPDVAAVVNAGTAHIELLGSTDAIARAKAEIWIGLRAGGTVVRPADDDRLAQLARECQPRARHVTFGERDADVALVEYAPDGDGSRLVLDVFGQRRELHLALVGR